MKNIFRALFLLQVYMFGVMASMSCSKNDSEPEIADDNNTPLAESSFYSYTQVPGSNPDNGLIAKQVLNASGDEIFFFGSFDEIGMPQSPKSFVVNKASTDTVMNVFVDAYMKPTMVYFSNETGEKYSTVWTYEWTSESTFVFRAFTYDWVTNTDNLNYESLVTVIDGQYQFDDNFVRSANTHLNMREIFHNNTLYRGGDVEWTSIAGAVVTGLTVALTVAVGAYGAVAYGVGTGLVAAAIFGSTLLVDTANAQTNPTTNTSTNTPPNPNDSPNPNPVSTPEDPTNLITTTTSTSDTTGTSGSTGTVGTTGTTGTTSTSSTTSTSDTLSTSGSTGTIGTTGTSGTVGTTGTSGSTGTTIDTSGMTVPKPRVSHQLRRELYENRKIKK